MPKHAALALVTIAVSLTFLGCAAAPPPTLYQRLGGYDAIVAVVDDAVNNVAADPRINQRFSLQAIPGLKKNLADLTETRNTCTYCSVACGISSTASATARRTRNPRSSISRAIRITRSTAARCARRAPPCSTSCTRRTG
jgi:anaerobic selenocysteine-containing dehydrogenase